MGTNFWSMKDASCGSAYDSASSRAHAPQAGAALKSTSTGLCCAFAWLSASSMSLFHETAIITSRKLQLQQQPIGCSGGSSDHYFTFPASFWKIAVSRAVFSSSAWLHAVMTKVKVWRD